MPQTHANARLRTVVIRTFVGSCCTLVSSIVNLSVLMALNGEPGWVCLLCCNCDILFSAVVIQWVTSRDNAGTSISSSLGVCNRHNGPNSTHHAAPGTAPRNKHHACHAFSHCLLDPAGGASPPTPTEFPLTTTTRCCSHGAEYDAESYCDDSMSMTAVKMLTAEHKRPAVIVTATIERETAPIGSLQSPVSTTPPPQQQRLPHQLLGRQRCSHVDTEAAATATAAVATATLGELRRGSKGIAAWEPAYGIHGRSSS
ncbi:hypothetical protein IF1G_00447 [Cordyceps javanica]|uniref:Uncharacterized protein n=1 Tax=Cordyceps javanica TaxID=43265 RepID=A0A545VFM3_9HYPO|nr:hypothetical protein IF1G_00447 [Cordyceps javanica]TQW11700.1 hypothetical protein IF2G_00431 [Cordyceps javanica]